MPVVTSMELGVTEMVKSVDAFVEMVFLPARLLNKSEVWHT